jgi:hypothetical protein
MYSIAQSWEIRRSAAVLEVVTVLGLIMFQIWHAKIAGWWGLGLAASVIIGGWWARKETCHDLGFVSGRFILFPAAIFLGKIFVANVRLDRSGWRGIVLGLIGYFAWAWLQQAALNSFFAKRCQEIGLSTKQTACCAGIVAGAIHMPNTLLVPVSLIGATAATYLFLRMRHKNIYLLAIGHAVIAIALLHALPLSVHHHFVIGPKFWAVR